MSVSKQSLQDFAKTVKTHPAFEEVLRLVKMNLFERWVNASDDERMVLGDIANNQALFVKEINYIFDTIDEDKPVNDEEDINAK